MSDIMRLAGINSGYDSEAMIEKMLQTYQTKIDTQNKKLTKLTWQQDAYRDITSKLTTFQSKYFDILKKDNYLMSPTSFSKFKSSISNKTNPDKSGGISVTTTSSSAVGTHSIKVSQIATATKLSGKSMTPSNFELDMTKALDHSEYTMDGDNRKYSYALDVKVGGVTKSVEFDVEIAQQADGTVDKDAFATAVQDALNTKLEEAFGLTGKVSGDSGVTGGLNAAGEEMFLKVEKDSAGNLKFMVGGNAEVTVTEKTGDFGMTRPVSKLAIAAQASVTGKNTVSVTAGGVTKNVSFFGVSSTYFDSRNDAGNEPILNQFNALKAKAYEKEYGKTPTASELENFSYTSTQAAKDKNGEALQDALNTAFRSEGIGFTLGSDGYLTAGKDFSMTVIEGGTLGIRKSSVSNRFASGTTLSEMGIASSKNEEVKFTVNGKEVSVKGSSTIDELVSAVNNSGAGVTMTYSKLENKFVVTANDMGNGGDVEFSANKFTAALGLAEDENTVKKAEIGKNAIIELDGVEIIHNANSYEIDGSTIKFDEAELGSKYDIGISKDYTDIKQSIKDFVKDYNQLIDDIYKYIDTAPQRDSKNNKYEPLTDAEKEEMSEKEIEKWEEAAKKGVLYNDSTVSGIMSKIRVALYGAVDTADGKKFGLYNMGIKTMEYKLDAHGKLQLDEDAFDAAFEEHADDIVKLFTDPNKGIMKQVNNVIDDAVKTTGKVKGSLVRKAGLETGSTSKDNEIYRQMEQIKKRIETLQDRYTAKEDYWWKVFTNLEKMMSTMNSQTSYMANFLNTGSTQQ